MVKLLWKIDYKLHNDLELHSDTTIQPNYEELFCKATELIAPFVQSKKIVVFFVRDKLIFNLTVADRIAEWMPNVIIYNLSKLEQIPDERNLMCVFLEELVHAYFCSFDEVFVGEKVAAIYNKISFNKTKIKYEFRK
jgi:hypothetical protein